MDMHISHPIPVSSLDDKVAFDGFPCLMAKTVIGSGNARRINGADLSDVSAENIQHTLQQIYTAIDDIKQQQHGFHSIIVEFAAPNIYCEHQFEALLWKFLQALHNADSKQYPWDSRVASDVHSAGYSFSLHEEAFYVIGMHPAASRKARQTAQPTIVFNLHSQFEKLRGVGSYTNIRDKIRERDMAYSGSVNPMLEDFGATSEAAQYSGRHFNKENWECPFKANQT